MNSIDETKEASLADAETGEGATHFQDEATESTKRKRFFVRSKDSEASGARVKRVQVLSSTINPMSRMSRWRHNVMECISKTEATVDTSVAVIMNSQPASLAEAEEARASVQYRLTASRRQPRSYYKRLKVALGMGGGSEESTHSGREGKWYDPNTALTKYLGVTFVCSLESFVGILFGGFIGAIVFGKVSRIQSVAQVMFSDPIVVRYGAGIDFFEDDEDEEEDDAAAESKTEEEQKGELPKKIKRIPCPILELRLVNTMHSKKGGEIMDATLNVVASINASTACPTLLASSKATNRKKKKNKKTIGVPFTAAIRKQLPVWGNNASEGATADLGSATMMEAVTTSAMVDEGNPNLVARKVFCKLNVEAPDHPFFKRVWFVRHELNVESPLLTAKARKLVRKNKGFWPEELNHHQGVRESIQFHQLMVSMSGTSNSSASSVYGQTIYNFVDVVIGYRFATTLFRDNQDHIRVDTSLINDVLEQNNGGGEPLTFTEKDQKRVMDLEDTG
eukprot:scaffold106810_cov57-Attheya_sp.AAC.1